MDQLIQSMKLLSDETRLRVTMLLFQEQCCVCQLTGITGIAQPKISKALSKMRDLNLVDDIRKDKYVYYKLKENLDIIKPFIESINNNIDKYPLLLEDQKKLDKREIYLSSCQSNIK